jgi:hypothetical protein
MDEKRVLLLNHIDGLKRYIGALDDMLRQPSLAIYSDRYKEDMTWARDMLSRAENMLDKINQSL